MPESKEPELKLTHQDLFDHYQHQLDWINRRLEPDTLEFYKESAETWKHAKEIAFDTYEYLRYYLPDGIPDYDKSIFYDESLVSDVPPITYENGYECPAVGILKYRDTEYPIYNDDYGMQSFIMINGRELPIESFSGDYDWYYELDRIIDKIYD